MKKHFLALAVLASAIASVAYTLPLPEVPQSMRIPAERADYVAAHFWDSLPAAPADSLGCEFWQQAVADCLTLFPHMSGDSARALAARQIVGLGRERDAYASCISTALETCLFEASSPQRDERLFADFLRLMADAFYPDSVRCEWLLGMVAKNLPGDKAADFSFTGSDGKERTLQASLALPTILYFYDPDCDDCHRLRDEMASDIILNSRISRGAAQVIAITLADEDAWRRSLPQMPSTWIVGRNDGSIDTDDIYLISSYPTLYLLAADGTVIAKELPYPRILTLLTAL